MTALALHTGRDRVEVDLKTADGPRRMAAETGRCILDRHLTAGSLDEVFRLRRERAEREIKLAGVAIEAHAALVPLAVALEDISLAGSALPESPSERRRDSFRSVGHHVNRPRAVAADRVAIASVAEREVRMVAEYPGIRGAGQCRGHRGLVVSAMLTSVALRARRPGFESHAIAAQRHH